MKHAETLDCWCNRSMVHLIILYFWLYCVIWGYMDQKLSDSFEGEDKINAMIFCKMSTKKMVCNLYLNEQKWICKSDTLMKKKSILQQVLFLSSLMRILELII